jgi:hypothetical protein
MPQLRLRPVNEVGRCAFCLRVSLREDLTETDEGDLICADREGCTVEYQRQETLGWKDHPAFSRSA